MGGQAANGAAWHTTSRTAWDGYTWLAWAVFNGRLNGEEGDRPLRC